MPYADPEKAKEAARRKYREKQYLWKNPDGSWKLSNTDTKANNKRHYDKNKEQIQLRAKLKRQKARAERTDNCPTCGALDVLVYDHDHKTGLFRNYICQSCNLALGHAKDNSATLRALAEYLDERRNEG